MKTLRAEGGRSRRLVAKAIVATFSLIALGVLASAGHRVSALHVYDSTQSTTSDEVQVDASALVTSASALRERLALSYDPLRDPARPNARLDEKFLAPNTAARLADDVLPMPKVSDPKLQNYVDNFYKGTTNPSRVGTGTTADAVRNELTTGLPTGGTFHSLKAQETVNGLQRWLRNNPNASYSDRLVGQSLLDDLLGALGGGR